MYNPTLIYALLGLTGAWCGLAAILVTPGDNFKSRFLFVAVPALLAIADLAIVTTWLAAKV